MISVQLHLQQYTSRKIQAFFKSVVSLEIFFDRIRVIRKIQGAEVAAVYSVIADVLLALIHEHVNVERCTL
jgi:hypothetical protein